MTPLLIAHAASEVKLVAEGGLQRRVALGLAVDVADHAAYWQSAKLDQPRPGLIVTPFLEFGLGLAPPDQALRCVPRLLPCQRLEAILTQCAATIMVQMDLSRAPIGLPLGARKYAFSCRARRQ